MIRARVTGANFEDITALIDTMAFPDLAPLAERVRGIMIEDNSRGLLAGQDCFGDEMTPVMESTIRRGRGGDGPPLVPQGASSRAASGYQVDVEDIPGGKRLTGSWPGLPWIGYHVTGTRFMVARDPVDLRPEGQEEVRAALDEFCRSLFGVA